MASKTGLPKSTIYEAIYGTSKLSADKELGLLAQDELCITEEVSWRTGLPMRTYGLTCEGLYKFLDDCFDDEEVWAKIEKIIQNWGHFIPFVSKRWDFFKKFGLIQMAIGALRHYTSGKSATGIPTSKDYLKYVEEDFDDFLYNLIEAVNPAQSREMFRKWLDALRNDDELRKKVERLYERRLLINEIVKQNYNLNLDAIRLIKSPKPDANQLELVMTKLDETSKRLDMALEELR
jgi:hypothetical protein